MDTKDHPHSKNQAVSLPPGAQILCQLIIELPDVRQLPDESCIRITDNAEIRGINPNVSSRYTVHSGALYVLAHDLNQLAVPRAIVNDFILIVKARCCTDCKVTALICFL